MTANHHETAHAQESRNMLPAAQNQDSQSQDSRSQDPYSRMTSNQRIRLYIFSLISGLIGAHAGLALFLGLTELNTLFYGTNPYAWQDLPWWRFVAPILGAGLICSIINQWIAPTGKPEGIPQVIKSVHEGEAPPPLMSGLVSAVQAIVTLGAGGSAGREGPAVHFASALVAPIVRLFQCEAVFAPYLVGSASAAAVAASFDAPFAGMLFSLEVVSRRIALKNAAPIVVAAAIGSWCHNFYNFDLLTFHVDEVGYPAFEECLLFAVLGGLCALVSRGLIHAIFCVEDLHNALKIPMFMRPLVGGVCVGLLVWQFPWVMGVGGELTRAALDAEFGLADVVMLLIAKIIAVGLTLGSRFAGGVFSPALVIGCLLGSAFGLAIGLLAEGYNSSLYSMAAMGAVAAATLGAPLSTILMTFELTLNTEAVVPVMISVVVSTILARRWTGWSFFDLVLWRARAVKTLPKYPVTDHPQSASQESLGVTGDKSSQEHPSSDSLKQ